MFTPKVSIVIPVYNGEVYLDKAIQSALAQEYTNFEIVIVNDGSKDSTQEIALQYVKLYPEKVRYFAKDNGGCGSALNYALDKIEGEYFSWLSHDDVYLSHKLQKQINVLNNLENKNTILYSGYELIDANSKHIGFVSPHEIHDEKLLNTSLFPLLRGLLHGCSMLIPVSYFKKIARFDETLKSTQDYDLWFKFLRKSPIKYVRDTLIQSRVHSEQGTHKIKEHIQECDQLWIGFIQDLSDVEMLSFEKNQYDFLKNMHEFLQTTTYNGATKYVHELIATLYPNKKELKNNKFKNTILFKVFVYFKQHGLINTLKKIKLKLSSALS